MHARTLTTKKGRVIVSADALAAVLRAKAQNIAAKQRRDETVRRYLAASFSGYLAN